MQMVSPVPLRVLMPTPRYFPSVGGVETHVHQVSQRLAHLGVAVTVLTTDTTGELPPREQAGTVTIVRVRAWPKERDWYFAPAIHRVIAQGGWDIVHCQSYHTLVAPIAMLAARQTNIPYVVTFHGGGSSSRFRTALRRCQWTALRPLLAQAARLIAVARFEIALYAEHLRIPAERFAFVPNGCDLGVPPLVAPALARSPLILSIGRLERYKGHQRAIAALPFVFKQLPDARLRIVGSGPYEPELRRLAERLGVADRVEIGGIPPEDRRGLADVLARASLVTLLSEYETHPIAALEAIAMRRSVLVANSSGLRELAAHGLARAVDLRSSPEGVAAAILDQLRWPLVPPQIELPTWEMCAAGLLDVYRSVTQRPLCAS